MKTCPHCGRELRDNGRDPYLYCDTCMIRYKRPQAPQKKSHPVRVAIISIICTALVMAACIVAVLAGSGKINLNDLFRFDFLSGGKSETITIPASIASMGTQDDLLKSAEEYGIAAEDVEFLEDGSALYHVTSAKKEEMMGEMKSGMEETIQQTIKESTSIKEIIPNDDYTQFTAKVDSAAFSSSFDSLLTLGLYISAAMYQCFDGVPESDIDVVIDYVDYQTGAAITSSSFKDLASQLSQ